MSAALRVSDDGFASTSIRLPKRTIACLRRAAAERALRSGQRFSISAVITDLVARHLAAPPACDAASNEQDDDDRRSR